MNSVNLIGNLTKDVQNFSDGQVAKFTIAVNKKKGADFINCTTFKKTAELLLKYTKKGDKIGVSGMIQTGSYTNKEGQVVYTTEVVVNQIYFLKKKDEFDTNAISEDELPFK